MTYFGEPFGFIHSKQPKWTLHTPPRWNEKRHFQPADYDLLEKERLAARKFGHVRHQVYHNILQPAQSSLAYASERERLRTDVDASVKVDNAKSKSRKKEILDCHKTERMHRETKALEAREKQWMRSFEREAWTRNEHPHARVIANRTSVPYDPITLQYHDGYEGERAKYTDAATRWRAAMRSVRIYRKMNGDRNYDVISWEPRPALVSPEKPNPPLPPPLNSTKSQHVITPAIPSLDLSNSSSYTISESNYCSEGAHDSPVITCKDVLVR